MGSRHKPKQIRPTPQDIDTIIHSFRGYALGDIQYNKRNPIAAMILCMCFIDQLAAFRFRLARDVNKRPEDFIDNYMPEYKGLDLYDMFRHSLIHTYSSEGKFDIDNKGNEDVPYAKKNGITYINTNVFIDYLEKAFENVVKDFKEVGSEAHFNATHNSMYYPVLVDRGS
jgi:hypothetical protein